MIPPTPSPEKGDDETESGPNRTGGVHARPVSENGYRWECPVCGLQRENTLGVDGRNAFRVLKTHVCPSDGDGHGGARTYPEEDAENQLRHYVTPVDDR